MREGKGTLTVAAGVALLLLFLTIAEVTTGRSFPGRTGLRLSPPPAGRIYPAAYCHVQGEIESGRARNLTWLFHADDGSLPKRPWNSIRSYYPGDRQVDWVGVSVYGPLPRDEPRGPGFRKAMSRVYPKLVRLSKKPIALFEFGSRRGPEKAEWSRQALKTIASRRFPRLRAISVWNEAWTNGDGSRSNLKIVSDAPTLRTYRRQVRRGPGRRVRS